MTTAIEHKSVIAPLEYLARLGWELVFLPVDGAGQVDLHQARELITEETLLVSVQAVLAQQVLVALLPFYCLHKINNYRWLLRVQ